MREAALPSAGYASPNNHFLSDGRNIVRVYPEAGRGFKDFSFDNLKVAPELQTLFAEGFALATGPSGTRRTIPSAANLFAGISTFVRLIASSPRPPARTAELRPVHLAELRMRHTASAVSALHALRVVLRSNPEVPMPFRNALFAPLPNARGSTLSVSYTKAEFRSIQRAARSDVRAALGRIRAGEVELGSWREECGQVSDGSARTGGPERSPDRGCVLNHLALFGDVPRYTSGASRGQSSIRGATKAFSSLFPTASEVAAMAVLFQCLTGQNLSTICNLTMQYSRADGASQGETKVLITRGSKPRRGPRKSEMDFSLTSIPAWIEPRQFEDEKDDYVSPFGLYMIAEELCRRARQLASTDALLVGHWNQQRASTTNGLGFRQVTDTSCTSLWKGWTDKDGKRQRVDSRRLRRTFVELHQRPVAHSAATLADTYLSRDAGSLAANQRVVQRILEAEVERITSGRIALVLTKRDVEQAATDAHGVAQRFGIPVEKLRPLLEGRLDTVATSCIDNKNGFSTEPGKPCTASFLLCLGCPNARSEPRQVPIQALLRQRLEALRDELPSQRWQQLYGTAVEQLDDLLKQQRADVAAAASRATSEDAALVEALLGGRLDLR